MATSVGRACCVAASFAYLVGGCASPEPHVPAAAPVSAQPTPDTAAASVLVHPDSVTVLTSALPTGYSLTDTSEWSSMMEEGQRAVLRRNGLPIDTVDLTLSGVAVVGTDSLVFLQVRTDTLPIGTTPTPAYESYPRDYFLWTPASRQNLSKILPYFDSYFSSPTITDKSTILYWGIEPRKGTNGLYAMRYDFRSAHVDSLFLNREDPLATDYRYHLKTPQVHGTQVSFDSAVVDATTWRIVSQAH